MKKLLVLSLFMIPGLTFEVSSQDLIITNRDLQIGGTLELPDGHEKGNPLVIMITGSGAQDRDETIFGFKPFQQIANHLKENGIASFRYDDREIGSSTGDFAASTLDDLSNDVDVIMDYFQFQAEEIFDDFILLGHSQGGVVSAKVAAKDDRVKGVILIASTTVPLKEVINEQVTLIQRAMGKSENDIEYILSFQEKAYETSRLNEGWDELKIEYQNGFEREVANLPAAQRQYIVDVEAFANTQFNTAVTPLRAPQMRSLLHHDPATDIDGLEIPILALFGGKDTQVAPSQNETVLVEICENDLMNCEIQNFADANHLFQKANSGFMNEYAMLPKEFVDGFLDSISDWVNAFN